MWKDPLLAKKINKIKYPVHIVVLALLVFGIVKINNVNLIDWDEGVFALQAKWFATGGVLGKPYNFQTPPLFPAIIALFFKLFGPNDTIPRIISLIVSLFTVYLVYFVTRRLYTEKEAVYAALLTAVSEFMLFFSCSGLSEAFFLVLFLLSIFTFFTALKKNLARYYLLTSLWITIALYTKYSAVTLIFIILIIGIIDKKSSKKWLAVSCLLPLIFYIPYLYIFIKLIGLPGLSSRHLHLLGFNHLKFLYYIFAFAPFAALFTLGYLLSPFKKFNLDDQNILTVLLVYFAALGFYYPYFRLAYPLIPFLSITAARFFTSINRRYRPPIIIVSIIISLGLSLDTITYKSHTPETVARVSQQYARQYRTNYIMTLVPPNIDFYYSGLVVIPQTSDWYKIGRRFPGVLKGHKVLKEKPSLFENQNSVLFVYSTIFDPLKEEISSVIGKGKPLNEMEFIDAPIYYKDIFNPLRHKKQNYQLYLLEIEKTGLNQINTIGLLPEVTVFFYKY